MVPFFVAAVIPFLSARPSTTSPWGDMNAVVASFKNSNSACCQSMAMFASDPAFVASHLSPKPGVQAPTDGKMIYFKTPYGELDGKAQGRGFYIPPADGNHNAVIMVHEFWGLNTQIEQAADKLHTDTGDAVLAVDLYDGQVTSDPAKASSLMSGVDEQRCAAILAGAIADLSAGPNKALHIGTVGYCFGGGWSERAAIIGSAKVQACVVYYGMPDMRPASLARLKAPVLFFEAGLDKWINPDVVKKFKDAMATAGKSFELHVYNANHAFANPSNPKYDAPAASDAYQREIAFFKSHLK